MTGPAPLRHALVIAPQNTESGLFDDLDDVARSMRDVLTDEWRGACVPSPVADAALLYGTSVGQGDIERAIRDAARRAAESGALLVVAFIGHGITSGGVPHLYLMAGDSRAGEPGSAVNLAEVLGRALEAPGLPGLVAVVDTCHAGGAVPDLSAVDGGEREGATRLSLLVAVGAAQEAHGLAFSRSVVRLLEQGVAGAGEFLSPEVVLDAVREATSGQDARLVHYDGARFGEPCWLARNASHLVRAGSVLGPLALEELESALAPLGGSALLPSSVTGVDVLDRLHGSLSGHAVPGGPSRREALDVVDGLRDVLRTVELLNSWPGGPLTTERLRQALRVAVGRGGEPLPDTSGTALLRDAVEYLRFRAQRQGETPTARLAVFVAALAVEDQLAEGTPAFTAWRHALHAKVELDDAFETLRRRDSRTRLRLIVSLHAALADEWPETLQAFLLDGSDVQEQSDFGCTPDQRGVEQGLVEALKWARTKSRTIGEMRRVEVVASAGLFLRWRPEETNFGERLGHRYDVVLRWSERMCPPDHLWWINERARERLTDMMGRGSAHAPVDWLGRNETASAEDLKARLERGEYTQAVGLRQRPQRIDQVLQLLLAHAPIVFWPGADGRMPDACRNSLDRFWHLLPAELSEAYRRSWVRRTRKRADGHAHLALWRSIWHDTEWLDFCDWFEQFVTEGEKSE